MCEVPSYVACQRGTSGRRVGSDGRLGAVGARGEPGAQVEGEREAEGEAEGVPLTNTPPLDEHRLDAEESEIGRKGIEPKARARMRHGAPGFLVWNSVTFSGAWLRFSQYSQVFRRLGFLEGVFHPICEFINCFEAGQRLMQFEAHPRVSAGIEEEGCLLHGQVDVIIVGELRQGEECVPVVLSFSNEDPQVLFQFLVDPFRLSIGLQVISGRRRGLDSQQSVQLLHEGGDELRSAVRHNFPRGAVELPDIRKVKVCCSGGGDCGNRFDEVGTFARGVDGHHDGVVSARFWEFRDEVHADDIPVFFQDRKRLEFSSR